MLFLDRVEHTRVRNRSGFIVEPALRFYSIFIGEFERSILVPIVRL
jgi:hypothetical protein